MSKARNLATLLESDGSVKAEKYVDNAGGQSTFVASGTLPNGTPVVLKADGTVEAVVLTGTTQNIPASSVYAFNGGTPLKPVVTFVPNTPNVFLITYTDNSNNGYLTGIIGTVSGTNITFGTKQVLKSAVIQDISVAFDLNTAGKFVVAFRWSAQSNQGHALSGQISGTSITTGSSYTFGTASNHFMPLMFDPHNADKFIIVYGNSARVGTVSGTSISYGTAVVNSVSFSTGTCPVYASFDPITANRFVITFGVGTNSATGVAKVATISGTSISLGADVTFKSSNIAYASVSFNPVIANQILIIFADLNTSTWASGNINGVVGTISGNNISFGTEVSANTVGHPTVDGPLAVTPDSSGRFVFPYRYGADAPTHRLKVLGGSVTGTSVSFNSDVDIYNANAPLKLSLSIDPNNTSNFVVVARIPAISDGIAILGVLGNSITNLTSTNFIGIPDAAYTDGQTATVTLPSGLSTNQTGLSVGSTYYVQSNGALSTAADNPSVEAGKALSATSILLKGI